MMAAAIREFQWRGRQHDGSAVDRFAATSTAEVAEGGHHSPVRLGKRHPSGSGRTTVWHQRKSKARVVRGRDRRAGSRQDCRLGRRRGHQVQILRLAQYGRTISCRLQEVENYANEITLGCR